MGDLNVDPSVGLSDAEARARLAQLGRNDLHTPLGKARHVRRG
jgi:hypothetical protein